MKIYMQQTLLSLFFVGAVINVAIADPVQVNITGRVIASPCTVDTTNSTLNIDLGDIQAAELSSAGIHSKLEKKFSIALKDCPPSTTKVTATFSGVADSSEPKGFANTGTATGVAVKIKQLADTWVAPSVTPNQATLTQNVSSTAHTAVFNLTTTAFTSSGVVTPGTIVSVMQVAFTYQ